MNHFEKTWIAPDGLDTYCQGWQPEAEIRAAVCLIHGLGEHSSRYAYVAERLGQGGFALIGADLRGHGKSAGARGHIASPTVYLDHIDRLLKEAGRQFPGLPLFLYGHSLGGILALFYTLMRQPELAGAVITSPGLRPALEAQKFKIFLAKTMGALTPTVRLPTGLDADKISRDPEIVSRYKSDPLVHDQASFAMAKYTLEMIPWIYEHASELELPLLVMHGTADEIAYARGSEELAAKIGPNCTLKLWDGLYHETHNEPEKEQVWDFMTTWLEEHL